MPFRPLLASLAVAAWLAGGAPPATAQADRPAPAERSAVQDVITSQMQAFMADDAERAYSYAAPTIKRMFPSPEVFMGMVRSGYQPVYRPSNPTFTRSRLLGEGRILQEVMVTGPRGAAWTAVYTLEKQPDGRWLITGCYLRQAEGAAV